MTDRDRADRPTMRQVARRSGVSLATVSYVVNGGPRPVSDELRDRVLTAIRELGYRRGTRGRARTRPQVVGVVVPDATNLFFSHVIASIDSALRSAGHLLVAASSGGEDDREQELLATFVRHQVDGLIVTPSRAVPGMLETLARDGLPVVLLDWDGGPTGLHRVVLDNYRSSFSATRLLIENGHRRIALINGPQSAASAHERLRGYVDALAGAGLKVSEPVLSGPFTHEQGRRATLELLSERRRPDAILSGSVLLTVGALQALQERSLRWPGDLAIVGYGHPRWGPVTAPLLTAVEQPTDQLGRAAVRLLLAGTRAGRQAGQRVELDCRLVVRDSHRHHSAA